MDVLTPEQRSRCMSQIRGKDTKPEMVVRKLTHALGFRYRLHDTSLPGKPDLVFKGKRKIIFIHGCYWHRHDCKYGKVTPKTNVSFWNEKFEKNVKRDQKVLRELSHLGWKILTIWECQTTKKNWPALTETIYSFLSDS